MVVGRPGAAQLRVVSNNILDIRQCTLSIATRCSAGAMRGFLPRDHRRAARAPSSFNNVALAARMIAICPACKGSNVPPKRPMTFNATTLPIALRRPRTIQFFEVNSTQPDRPSRVEFVGGNANLCAEAETRTRRQSAWEALTITGG